MYTTILLPIDLGHEASWSKALPEALGLVRVSGGTLHLLSVVPDFGMSVVSGFFPDGFEAKVLAKAGEELAAFGKAHVPADIPHETHLGHGTIHDRILATAADVSADLIIMASHDPSQIRDFLVGSHADRVVHHAKTSVLVVRG